MTRANRTRTALTGRGTASAWFGVAGRAFTLK
jgi:hypothetical protein